MPAAPSPAVRRWIAALGLAAALAYLGVAARHLIVRDLSLDYPFRGADDLDWISNALALGGEDVRYTGRLPLFPLVLLALERLGRLGWAPVVQQAILLALAGLAFLLARRRGSSAAAVAVALSLGLAHAVQTLALGISADLLATTLLAAATWLLLAASGRPARLLAAGAAAGLSAVTQGAAHLWLAVAIVVVALDREARRPRRWLAAALGLYALPSLLWALLGPPGSGDESIVLHRELLAPSFAHLGFYARATLSFLGLPGLAIVVLGLATAWRSRDVPEIRFAVAWAGTLTVFFGVAYDFPDERFLIYSAPAVALLLAEGLRRFAAKPALLAAVALALVAGAAWPWSDGDGGRSWTPRRVVAAKRDAMPQPTIAPAQVADLDGVVYLARDGEDVDSRYLHQYRLGNVLRRRVRVVAASLYPVAWWNGFTRVGSVGTTVVYRGRWAGGDELAVATEDPDVLAALARAPESGPAIDPDAWATARAIAALAPAPDGLVLALGDPTRDGDWLRLLPVVARTTSVFVPTGDDRATALAMAADAPCGRPRKVAGVEICEMTLRWRLVVAFAPSVSRPRA